ncbi:hypothetical protein M431DRAFT_511887 [Trichoderma harzianum CBS 226.95]|uniref:Uncharacterized protein n=1 Tax=Trichoderma harzianum CBS 226.95 TaxID=983964 RepID=A0A2T3ZZS4_TRIHA|nr:hypothetical protein M431DRAFT_511887 [Trichoderma harzianum CBS 226.95]PTB50314.1 hypothetical protein M431DRAFT_511887 [Trichoderma harzianum CBS 226.95]
MYSYSLGCHSHKCFLDGETDPDRNFGFGHFRQSSIRRGDSLEGIPTIDPGLAYSCNGTPGAVRPLSFQQSFHGRGRREPRRTHAHVPHSCQRTGACTFRICAIMDALERYMHGASCIQAAFNVERPPRHAPLLVISHVDLEIATPGRIFSGSSVAPCQSPLAKSNPGL